MNTSRHFNILVARRDLWNMLPKVMLLGVMLVGWGSGAAWAQFGRNRLDGNRDGMTQEQILLAPRQLTRLLREGKAAIEEKRYSDGIEALGTLLLEEARDDLPEDTLHQDYFTEAGGDSYYKTSVRGEALRLLGSIPEEGRKTLEIQYGVSARQALQVAVAARDMEAISEVTRKYYHTEAGYDASVLLAQDKLIRGYPIAAAGILDRLSAFPAARKRFGAQLISEVAGAWMQSGRLDLAVKSLEDGAKNFAGASILLNNRQVKLDGSQEWPKLLAQAYPKQGTMDSRRLDSWLMTGGQPDRNGSVSAGLPMPMAAWHMTLHRDRSDEELVTMLAGRQSQSGTALLPKLEARMLGDIVLAKTATANVFAIDLETGLRKWPFYKDAVPVSFNPRMQSIGAEAEEYFMHNNLRNRIWGSSAFGQFTIDANQLYYITNSEDQRLSQPIINLQRVSAPVANNLLIGVSLQGEGKEMWQVGGSDSLSEPELKGAYFLGPPLSFEGDLYTLIEINMETRLVVLDARTGKIQWSQQLTLSPMNPIRTDPLRQSQALTPSVSDAVIVCPVGNGALIAVDLLTRSLLWGKQYVTTTAAPNQFPFNTMGDQTESYEPTDDRWAEPQVIIHNGRIIFTPPETTRIMCLDLLTGTSRWEQQRGPVRYVAGIHNNQAILVSNTSVYAVGLSDGQPTWSDVLLSAKLPNSKERPVGTTMSEPSGNRQRETIAGKSVRDGKMLYVPTTARRVLQIDLDEGRLVDATTVEQPLGNLFSFKNRMISVGSTRITAYYTKQSLASEVEQRLAANAKDNRALNQKSLLLSADGQVSEAIELLRQSYAIDPENGETRYLLVDALLAGLESDFDRYLPLATEFEPIIESQRFRFLVMLAKGNLTAGQHELAFSRLMELVRERATARQPGLQSRLQTMTLTKGHQVDIDAWIAVQLGRVLENAKPESRERMLATVKERLATTMAAHPVTRELELRFLTWIEPAQAAVLNLASGLLGDSDQTKAERLLQPILFSANKDLRTQAEDMMRQNAKADNDAMLSYRMGATDAVEAAINPAAPFRSPIAALEPAEPRLVPSNFQWPTGMVEANINRNDGPVTFNTMRLRQMGNRYGREPVDLAFANDHLIVNNTSGQTLAHCPLQRNGNGNEASDPFLRAQVDGGLVFLETLTELLAFDMYRGKNSPADACLWRYSLSKVQTGPRKPHAPSTSTSETSPLGIRTHSRAGTRESIIGPITPAGIVLQKNTEVILLDAMTGEAVWSRDGYDATTSLVANGLEVSVVSSSTGKIDILDCRDGTLLRQAEHTSGWKSWFAQGKHLVQFLGKSSGVRKSGIQVDGVADSCSVRLIDAFTGKVVVETEFAPNSRAECSGDRFIVVLEESGRFWYCDTVTGKAVEHQLPKQTKLRYVQLQQFGDRLVAWSSQASAPSLGIKPDIDDQAMARGLLAINGTIVALDIESGQLLWDRPGTLRMFSFNSSQPRNSPFMGCYRIVPVGGNRTGHLAVLDLRDGTLAYANTSLPVGVPNQESQEFAMRLDPLDSSVMISIGATSVKLRFTNEEKPPQPVCFFGDIPIQSKQRGQPLDLLK